MPHSWLQQLELWLAEQPPLPKTPSSPPPAAHSPHHPDAAPVSPLPDSQTASKTDPKPPDLPLAIPLIFKRNQRARRYILRVARDGTVHVTIPKGGSEAFAHRFAIEKESWIRLQLQRLAQPSDGRAAWGPGSPVWFRGERLPLVASQDHVRLGDFVFPLPASSQDWRTAVERHLRMLAAAELPPLVLGAADLHGLAVQRVQIRDQRSRWGSCSRHGTISLNWRLVQVPVFVRDYLIAHELAHLRQMNHSRRFWAVVEEFYPSWRDAERWLRENARRLLS